MATYREVVRLQHEHDRTELTSALESMSTQITDWKASYGVGTPGELRASIADCEDPTEIEDRREVATEWEHLADRIPIVRAALNEYGLVAKHDSI